jgi:hypothetical protein
LSFPSINNLYVSNLTIFLNGAAWHVLTLVCLKKQELNV